MFRRNLEENFKILGPPKIIKNYKHNQNENKLKRNSFKYSLLILVCVIFVIISLNKFFTGEIERNKILIEDGGESFGNFDEVSFEINEEM